MIYGANYRGLFLRCTDVGLSTQMQAKEQQQMNIIEWTFKTQGVLGYLQVEAFCAKAEWVTHFLWCMILRFFNKYAFASFNMLILLTR